MKRKLQPPFYFFACLLLIVGLHFILPVFQLFYSPYKYAGILLVVIGIWLNLRVDNLFKKKRTTVKPGEKSFSLVLEGPFLWSRNPMYLGMVAILLGAAAVLGSLSAFAAPVIFFLIMDRFFIPREEKMLEGTFREEFLNYKKKVRRWL